MRPSDAVQDLDSLHFLKATATTAFHSVRLSCLAAACALMSLPVHAQSADLAARVDQLSSELAAVKAQLAAQSASAPVANGANGAGVATTPLF